MSIESAKKIFVLVYGDFLFMETRERGRKPAENSFHFRMLKRNSE